MRDRTSTFGDHAFSVLFSYLSPLTWLSLFALVAFWVVVGAVLGSSKPTSLASIFLVVILVAFISSAVVGRFAAGARSGEFGAGLVLNGSSFSEAFQFAINHLALLFVWELPLLGIILLMKDSALGLVTPFSDGGGKGSAMLLVIVVFIAAVGPTITALVAVCADSLAAAFNPALWRRILGERLDDVLFFYVCLFGGVIMFGALYAVPLALIALLVPSEAPPVAALVMRLSMWLPPLVAGTVPILTGRLAGAFAYTEIYAETPAPVRPVTVASPNVGATGAAPVAAAVTAGVAPRSQPTISSGPLREPSAPLSSASIEWLKNRLNTEPLVLAAYLFEKQNDAGDYERKIGLELDAGSSLADRQKIFLSLSADVPQGPLAADEVGVALLNETTRAVIQRVGTLVYRRE